MRPIIAALMMLSACASRPLDCVEGAICVMGQPLYIAEPIAAVVEIINTDVYDFELGSYDGALEPDEATLIENVWVSTTASETVDVSLYVRPPGGSQALLQRYDVPQNDTEVHALNFVLPPGWLLSASTSGSPIVAVTLVLGGGILR